MAQQFLSIGECMVEMASTESGLFRQGFAGDTFNTAWYARQALGPDWQVDYYSAVGDDVVSTRMLAFMTAQGIGTRHVQRFAGRTAGLYLIELNNGERSFTYWRDTAAARNLADDEAALQAAISQSAAIYFSGITLAILRPGARENLFAALARAKAEGKLVAFDSNIRLRLWKDKAEMCAAFRSAARVTTLALPTVPDEPDVFGEIGAEAVAQRYLDDGVAEVVVKAGPDPALLIWPKGRQWIGPERAIIPVDTTGAGDSFNGAYIAARLSGAAPDVAARTAHGTAGRVVQSYGALV